MANEPVVTRHCASRDAPEVYVPVEVFEAGPTTKLIQGWPMEWPYYDCIGNGKTYIRPNC